SARQGQLVPRRGRPRRRRRPAHDHVAVPLDPGSVLPPLTALPPRPRRQEGHGGQLTCPDPSAPSRRGEPAVRLAPVFFVVILAPNDWVTPPFARRSAHPPLNGRAFPHQHHKPTRLAPALPPCDPRPQRPAPPVPGRRAPPAQSQVTGQIAQHFFG